MKMHEILRWRSVMGTLALSWLVAAAYAQDAKKVVEPEYVGVVFSFDPDARKLVPLERQQANTQAKAKALGFGGASVSLMFAGAKSPVRFRVDQKLEFVFKIDAASKGVEPERQYVNLDALQ